MSGEKVGVASAAADDDDTDAHNDDDAVDHAAQRQPVVSVVPACFHQGRNMGVFWVLKTPRNYLEYGQ